MRKKLSIARIRSKSCLMGRKMGLLPLCYATPTPCPIQLSHSAKGRKKWFDLICASPSSSSSYRKCHQTAARKRHLRTLRCKDTKIPAKAAITTKDEHAAAAYFYFCLEICIFRNSAFPVDGRRRCWRRRGRRWRCWRRLDPSQSKTSDISFLNSRFHSPSDSPKKIDP